MTHRTTPFGPLALSTPSVQMFRVGWAPDAFGWTPWEYADAGRFHGRWDDPDGLFRTLYVGEQLLGCLLEVLAAFRPDLTLAAELAGIDDVDGDGVTYPTLPAGRVPRAWLEPRRVSTAVLSGAFVDVRAATTLATLRRSHADLAADLGLPDLDAAAVKMAAPRTLTQAVSSWFYRHVTPPVAGVCFASRFGDDLTLWAVYEHAAGTADVATLTQPETSVLYPDDPVLAEAFRVHRLTWA